MEEEEEKARDELTKCQTPARRPVGASLFVSAVHATRLHPRRLLDNKNIQHTVRYTELSPTQFKDFWRD